MRIDWLTVGAQVVNFLILVFLLRRFLYRPVLEAMARREKRIADRLNEAAAREQAAKRMADDYAKKMADIESQHDEMVARAKEEADAQRRRMLDAARGDVEQAEARWRDDLRREQQEFLGAARREIAMASESVARKALADLAAADLEQRMIATLLDRLDRLGDAEMAALADAAGGVTVRSAFKLDGNQRSQITRALHERFGTGAPVHYVTDPALVCGLALEGGGRRLGWNVADYMQALEQRLRDRLAALEDEPAAEPPGPPQVAR
jgi:F-type H+-transporting ATPase subunit b